MWRSGDAELIEAFRRYTEPGGHVAFNQLLAGQAGRPRHTVPFGGPRFDVERLLGAMRRGFSAAPRAPHPFPTYRGVQFDTDAVRDEFEGLLLGHATSGRPYRPAGFQSTTLDTNTAGAYAGLGNFSLEPHFPYAFFEILADHGYAAPTAGHPSEFIMDHETPFEVVGVGDLPFETTGWDRAERKYVSGPARPIRTFQLRQRSSTDFADAAPTNYGDYENFLAALAAEPRDLTAHGALADFTADRGHPEAGFRRAVADWAGGRLGPANWALPDNTHEFETFLDQGDRTDRDRYQIRTWMPHARWGGEGSSFEPTLNDENFPVWGYRGRDRRMLHPEDREAWLRGGSFHRAPSTYMPFLDQHEDFSFWDNRGADAGVGWAEHDMPLLPAEQLVTGARSLGNFDSQDPENAGLWDQVQALLRARFDNGQRLEGDEAPTEYADPEAGPQFDGTEPWHHTRGDFLEDQAPNWGFPAVWRTSRLEGHRLPRHDFDEPDLQDYVGNYLKDNPDADVHRVYVPVEHLPNPQLAELDEGFGVGDGYDWESFEVGTRPFPPVTLLYDEDGKLHIIDGNHRVHHWSDRYTHVPAFLIDQFGHKASVRAALAAGLPVPPEVLADYPDLAPAGPVGYADPAATRVQAPWARPVPQDLVDARQGAAPRIRGQHGSWRQAHAVRQQPQAGRRSQSPVDLNSYIQAMGILAEGYDDVGEPAMYAGPHEPFDARKNPGGFAVPRPGEMLVVDRSSSGSHRTTWPPEWAQTDGAGPPPLAWQVADGWSDTSDLHLLEPTEPDEQGISLWHPPLNGRGVQRRVPDWLARHLMEAQLEGAVGPYAEGGSNMDHFSIGNLMLQPLHPQELYRTGLLPPAPGAMGAVKDPDDWQSRMVFADWLDDNEIMQPFTDWRGRPQVDSETGGYAYPGYGRWQHMTAGDVERRIAEQVRARLGNRVSLPVYDYDPPPYVTDPNSANVQRRARKSRGYADDQPPTEYGRDDDNANFAQQRDADPLDWQNHLVWADFLQDADHPDAGFRRGVGQSVKRRLESPWKIPRWEEHWHNLVQPRRGALPDDAVHHGPLDPWIEHLWFKPQWSQDWVTEAEYHPTAHEWPRVFWNPRDDRRANPPVSQVRPENNIDLWRRERSQAGTNLTPGEQLFAGIDDFRLYDFENPENSGVWAEVERLMRRQAGKGLRFERGPATHYGWLDRALSWLDGVRLEPKPDDAEIDDDQLTAVLRRVKAGASLRDATEAEGLDEGTVGDAMAARVGIPRSDLSWRFAGKFAAALRDGHSAAEATNMAREFVVDQAARYGDEIVGNEDFPNWLRTAVSTRASGPGPQAEEAPAADAPQPEGEWDGGFSDDWLADVEERARQAELDRIRSGRGRAADWQLPEYDHAAEQQEEAFDRDWQGVVDEPDFAVAAEGAAQGKRRPRMTMSTADFYRAMMQGGLPQSGPLWEEAQARLEALGATPQPAFWGPAAGGGPLAPRTAQAAPTPQAGPFAQGLPQSGLGANPAQPRPRLAAADPQPPEEGEPMEPGYGPRAAPRPGSAGRPSDGDTTEFGQPLAWPRLWDDGIGDDWGEPVRLPAQKPPTGFARTNYGAADDLAQMLALLRQQPDDRTLRGGIADLAEEWFPEHLQGDALSHLRGDFPRVWGHHGPGGVFAGPEYDWADLRRLNGDEYRFARPPGEDDYRHFGFFPTFADVHPDTDWAEHVVRGEPVSGPGGVYFRTETVNEPWDGYPGGPSGWDLWRFHPGSGGISGMRSPGTGDAGARRAEEQVRQRAYPEYLAHDRAPAQYADRDNFLAGLHAEPLYPDQHRIFADFLQDEHGEAHPDVRFRRDLADLLQTRLGGNLPSIGARTHPHSLHLAEPPRGFSGVPELRVRTNLPPHAAFSMVPGYNNHGVWDWEDHQWGIPDDPNFPTYHDWWAERAQSAATRARGPGAGHSPEEWAHAARLTPAEQGAYDIEDLADVDPALWPQVEALLRGRWDGAERFSGDEQPTEYADETDFTSSLARDPRDVTTHGAFADWAEEAGHPDAALRRAIQGSMERRFGSEWSHPVPGSDGLLPNSEHPTYTIDPLQFHPAELDVLRFDPALNETYPTAARIFGLHGDVPGDTWHWALTGMQIGQRPDALRERFAHQPPRLEDWQRSRMIGLAPGVDSNELLHPHQLSGAERWFAGIEDLNSLDGPLWEYVEELMRHRFGHGQRLAHDDSPTEYGYRRDPVAELFAQRNDDPNWADPHAPTDYSTPEHDRARLGFERSVLAAPADATIHGAYADWLDEEGQALEAWTRRGIAELARRGFIYPDTYPGDSLFGPGMHPSWNPNPKPEVPARPERLPIPPDFSEYARTNYGDRETLQQRLVKTPWDAGLHGALGDWEMEHGDPAEGAFRHAVDPWIRGRWQTPPQRSIGAGDFHRGPTAQPWQIHAASTGGPVPRLGVVQPRESNMGNGPYWAGVGQSFNPAFDEQIGAHLGVDPGTFRDPGALRKFLDANPLLDRNWMLGRRLSPAENTYLSNQINEETDPALWPQLEAILRERHRRGEQFADDDAPAMYGLEGGLGVPFNPFLYPGDGPSVPRRPAPEMQVPWDNLLHDRTFEPWPLPPGSVEDAGLRRGAFGGPPLSRARGTPPRQRPMGFADGRAPAMYATRGRSRFSLPMDQLKDPREPHLRVHGNSSWGNQDAAYNGFVLNPQLHPEDPYFGLWTMGEGQPVPLANTAALHDWLPLGMWAQGHGVTGTFDPYRHRLDDNLMRQLSPLELAASGRFGPVPGLGANPRDWGSQLVLADWLEERAPGGWDEGRPWRVAAHDLRDNAEWVRERRHPLFELPVLENGPDADPNDPAIQAEARRLRGYADDEEPMNYADLPPRLVAGVPIIPKLRGRAGGFGPPRRYGLDDDLRAFHETAQANPLDWQNHLIWGDYLQDAGQDAEAGFRRGVGQSVQRRLAAPQDSRLDADSWHHPASGIPRFLLPHIRKSQMGFASGEYAPRLTANADLAEDVPDDGSTWAWRPFEARREHGNAKGAAARFYPSDHPDLAALTGDLMTSGGRWATPLTPAEQWLAGITDQSQVPEGLWAQVEALMRQQHRRGRQFADDDQPTAYADDSLAYGTYEDEYAAFLRALRADPQDLTARKVFADFLQDHGRSDPLPEYLRTHEGALFEDPSLGIGYPGMRGFTVGSAGSVRGWPYLGTAGYTTRAKKDRDGTLIWGKTGGPWDRTAGRSPTGPMIARARERALAEGGVYIPDLGHNNPFGQRLEGDDAPTAYDDRADERKFQHQIRTNPLDVTNHLVFSDWLRDRDREADADFSAQLGGWVGDRAAAPHTDPFQRDLANEFRATSGGPYTIPVWQQPFPGRLVGAKGQAHWTGTLWPGDARGETTPGTDWRWFLKGTEPYRMAPELDQFLGLPPDALPEYRNSFLLDEHGGRDLEPAERIMSSVDDLTTVDWDDMANWPLWDRVRGLLRNRFDRGQRLEGDDAPTAYDDPLSPDVLRAHPRDTNLLRIGADWAQEQSGREDDPEALLRRRMADWLDTRLGQTGTAQTDDLGYLTHPDIDHKFNWPSIDGRGIAAELTPRRFVNDPDPNNQRWAWATHPDTRRLVPPGGAAFNSFMGHPLDWKAADAEYKWRHGNHQRFSLMDLSPVDRRYANITPFADMSPEEYFKILQLMRTRDSRLGHFADDGQPTNYATGYNLEEQRAFEESLRAGPLNATTHGVYADWLQEHGQDDEAAFRRDMHGWVGGLNGDDLREVQTLHDRWPWRIDPAVPAQVPPWVDPAQLPTDEYLRTDPPYTQPEGTPPHRGVRFPRTGLFGYPSYEGMEDALREQWMARRGPRVQSPAPDDVDHNATRLSRYGAAEDRMAFLNAIRENPADTTNALVFADWLREHGDDPALADLIQAHVGFHGSGADVREAPLGWGSRAAEEFEVHGGPGYDSRGPRHASVRGELRLPQEGRPLTAAEAADDAREAEYWEREAETERSFRPTFAWSTGGPFHDTNLLARGLMRRPGVSATAGSYWQPGFDSGMGSWARPEDRIYDQAPPDPERLSRQTAYAGRDPRDWSRWGYFNTGDGFPGGRNPGPNPPGWNSLGDVNLPTHDMDGGPFPMQPPTPEDEAAYLAQLMAEDAGNAPPTGYASRDPSDGEWTLDLSGMGVDPFWSWTPEEIVEYLAEQQAPLDLGVSPAEIDQWNALNPPPAEYDCGMPHVRERRPLQYPPISAWRYPTEYDEGGWTGAAGVRRFERDADGRQ